MPNYGRSYDSQLMDYEIRERQREIAKRQAARDDVEKRKDATIAKVRRIRLGNLDTDVSIAELLDKDYEVKAMNESEVLMVKKGTVNAILR